MNIRGHCLLRGRNYDKIMDTIDVCNISYMNIYQGNINITSEVLLKKYFDENSINMNNEKENKKMMKKSIHFENKKSKDEEKNNNENNYEEKLDIVPDIFKDEIIDEELNREIYDIKEVEENEGNKNKHQYLLIIGDKSGNMKIIDLIGFIKKNKLIPSTKSSVLSALNIYKKDDINMSGVAKHIISLSQRKIFPKFTNFYHKMIIKEFKPHYEEITCINIINEPLSIATCSKDGFCKIFNFNCECLGVINWFSTNTKYPQITDIKWKFRTNEKKSLENEKSEIIKLFDKVGVKKFSKGIEKETKFEKIPNKEGGGKTVEQNEKIKRIYNKKRFKKIIKEGKVNEKSKIDEEDRILSNEEYFIFKFQGNIEKMLLDTNESNTGISVIKNKLIDSAVESMKHKKKKLINHLIIIKIIFKKKIFHHFFHYLQKITG